MIKHLHSRKNVSNLKVIVRIGLFQLFLDPLVVILTASTEPCDCGHTNLRWRELLLRLLRIGAVATQNTFYATVPGVSTNKTQKNPSSQIRKPELRDGK